MRCGAAPPAAAAAAAASLGALLEGVEGLAHLGAALHLGDGGLVAVKVALGGLGAALGQLLAPRALGKLGLNLCSRCSSRQGAGEGGRGRGTSAPASAEARMCAEGNIRAGRTEQLAGYCSAAAALAAGVPTPAAGCWRCCSSRGMCAGAPNPGILKCCTSPHCHAAKKCPGCLHAPVPCVAAAARPACLPLPDAPHAARCAAAVQLAAPLPLPTRRSSCMSSCCILSFASFELLSARLLGAPTACPAVRLSACWPAASCLHVLQRAWPPSLTSPALHSA